MASVNKVILIGNVGETPDVRYFPDGTPVVTLSLATTEKWKDKKTNEQRERTEWHRVVLRGRTAEIAGEYVGKGKELYIEGKNRTRSYEKDGVTRYVTEVYAHEMQMTGNKASSMPQAPADDTPGPDAADLEASE
jgi:single-strand DNA-binding protein